MNAIDCLSTARVASCLAAARRRGLPGSRMKLGLFAHAGALAALSLASAACSSVSAATPPVAAVSSGAPVCHATSSARVLARRVFVPGGVQATAQDGTFSVRFAADPSRCAAVDWPSATQRTELGSCRASGGETAARTNDADDRMLAWDLHDAAAPDVAPGVITDDTPRAFFGFGMTADGHGVARPFRVPAGSEGVGEAAPALAPLGHDRFLLAWVDGNSEGHQLRAQSIVGWGDPLGAAMVLSPGDASVIGRPSVVVAPTGYGLVTYVASIEGEFDVLATPIACAMN
jgi:hypothetical protein